MDKYYVISNETEVIIFRGSMREVLDCGHPKEQVSNVFYNYKDAMIWAGIIAAKWAINIPIRTEY